MDDWIRGELGVGEKIIDFARGKWGVGALAAGGSIYIVFLSLPFVPGVELEISLMCAFRKQGIVFVYIATAIGLAMAFLMGRMLPKKRVENVSDKRGWGGITKEEEASMKASCRKLTGRDE